MEKLRKDFEPEQMFVVAMLCVLLGMPMQLIYKHIPYLGMHGVSFRIMYTHNSYSIQNRVCRIAKFAKKGLPPLPSEMLT